MEIEDKFIIGKLNYDELEIMEEDNRSVFEKIMSFLKTEHENLTEKEPKRRLDFEAVGKMFIKKLQSISKQSQELSNDQITEYITNTEELLKTNPSTASKSESEEDEFIIYKEKEKGHKFVKKNVIQTKATEEYKIIPKKVEKKVATVNDNYTLADLIPIKGRNEKKPKKEKKTIAIKASAQPWPAKEDTERILSLNEIIKQEQEQKELDIILKQIEYQEDLEKAIELSKKEYEQNQTNQQQQHEHYSYNSRYQRHRGHRRQVTYRRRHYY